uniref:VIER F-box protein 2 n=1 Tax=Tanacetum cinerariifolium TaxID=118510 RepID=A0A6L2MG76_TANCI|nr:VIER F-box protein 2 [Tanacetum cinerariifolium]
MDNDLFMYEVKVANIPCDLNGDDDSEQQMSHEANYDMGYDPSDVEFTEWLTSIKFNYKTMDHYTKKALWIYWIRGDDEVELTDKESSNNDDEVVEVFRIDTNVFGFETPMCKAFKEFNYLLQINLDLPIKDIEGFKTYEEYKDDWIYEWNIICAMGAYIIGNTHRYQDLEWYDALKDSELKEEALRNKAIMAGLINEDVESNDEDDERHELCGNETHEFSVCNIRRFEMIKYSFRQDEEYVVVKENEYEDLTSKSKDACRAYQEIFRMMDEGWMDLAEKKLTMLVKYLQSGNLEVLES